MKIGIIGAGNMGFALMNGFLSSGLTTPDNIIASGAKNDTKAQKNVDSAGSKWTTDNNFLVRESDVIILAVKPNMVYHVLAEVQQTLNEDKLVLSVALGFTVAKLESAMPPKTRVIRVMPNTPAMVQSGASVFCPGKEATEADCEVAKKLLSSVGTCYQIPEYQMDAVTAISGCGPAYMYMALEALTEAGVRHGLARNLALDLAAQTMLGSAKMVMETGRDPAILRGEVCSPGGATIDGVFTLEKEGFRAALMCAADAAFKKSVEFSGKK